MKISDTEKVRRWRRRMKDTMIKAMGGSCQVCGYDRCSTALEFHHLDPNEKEHSFSSLRANPKGIEVLIAELKKCVMLCSNCHKEVHDDVASLPATYATLNEDIMWANYKKRK